ncbi:hypothetical protein C8J55DRAFT_557669 [Lentinula edodes]|uniref:Uncharacterized protein n=1 Tax=Lentinula lateritia TaxID=40482 RepID=A0A9W9DXS5_9AGAR|nr:hypothetical protein C8J55DRAFT_557669 [Lentinula edodes]
MDSRAQEPDLEGHRVVLPSASTSSSTSTSSTSPDTETNASTLSWFARKKANAAKAAAQEEAEQRQKEERTKAGVHVQRPPSYASWVGRGKGEEKAEEELPPREGRDTPPLPTRMASPTPILGSDSRSSTPTSNSNSNSNSTSSFFSTTSTSSTTNSGHITSPLPRTAGFDLAAIKAELAGLKGVESAVEAPRMGGRFHSKA